MTFPIVQCFGLDNLLHEVGTARGARGSRSFFIQFRDYRGPVLCLTGRNT